MRILSLFAAVVIGSLAVSPAKAVTSYDLSATSQNPLVFESWSLTFDDLDEDVLVSKNEITSFTGFSCFGFGCNFTFVSIFIVPIINTISDGPLVAGGTNWTFLRGDGGQGVFVPLSWSYIITPSPIITPIPLPAPLLLLVTALAGLFGVSRFKRQAVVAA